MDSQAAVFFITMLGVEIVIGITVNTFILVMHIGLWLKHRNLKAIDLILTCLGLVRFLLLVLIALVVSSALFGHWLRILKWFVKIFLSGIDFANFCSLWFGTLLCVFYCVKITNYSHGLFIQLKKSISRMAPRFLVVVVAFSYVSALPYCWFVYKTHVYNSMNNASGSFGQQVTVMTDYLNGCLFYLAGASVPLIIFCIAIYLLVKSLWGHLESMKTMNVGFRNPRLEAHINAVKSMLCFMFLYCISVVATSCVHLSIQSGSKTWISITFIIASSCPCLHSIALILSHKTLKEPIQRLFNWVWVSKCK